MIGTGKTRINWPRYAVQTAAKAISKGLQFFVGHNRDNSTNGRQSAAEVIVDFAKEIGGKLSHIVIGQFPSKAEANNYDVCSIEADVTYRETETGMVAEAIDKITGIALGNSQHDKPAFPGAERLASLQAFEAPVDDNNKATKPEGDSTMPTFAEVKQFCRDQNVYPHQLFDENIMRADHVFGKIYTDRDDAIKRAESAETKFADLEKSSQTALAEAKQELAKIGVNERLEKLLPEGATAAQKTFIKKNFELSSPEDLTDEGLSKFIEGGMNQFQSLASAGLISADAAGAPVGEGEPKNNDDGDNNGSPEQDASTVDDAVDLIVN